MVYAYTDYFSWHELSILYLFEQLPSYNVQINEHATPIGKILVSILIYSLILIFDLFT